MTVVINGTTGITSPEMAVDNGAADGGQVVLKSSGFNNWNIDNYSGNCRFYYNATELMRIDSSGNVGIGTSSPVKHLQIGNNSTASEMIRFATTAANFDVGMTASGCEITTGNNQPIIFTNNATERMRIDSSGNVGIGTSSPTKKLEVGSLGAFRLQTGSVTMDCTPTPGGIDGFVWNVSAGYYDWSIGGSSKMRIDSSGNLLVGTTTSAAKITSNTGASNAALATRYSGANGASGGLYSVYDNTTGTAYGVVFFYNGFTSQAGQITYSSTTVTYGTSSDYRLKENVQPMTGALAKVAALKPVTYTWKSTGESSQGFIAHELQEVVPECVTGEKDAVKEDGSPEYQGIDTSFLVATLTAAIQELNAKVDAQAAEIAALKGNA